MYFFLYLFFQFPLLLLAFFGKFFNDSPLLCADILLILPPFTASSSPPSIFHSPNLPLYFPCEIWERKEKKEIRSNVWAADGTEILILLWKQSYCSDAGLPWEKLNHLNTCPFLSLQSKSKGLLWL